MTICIRGLLLSSILVTNFVSATPIEIRTAAQDSQPKFIKESNTISGLCIDIFHAIERINPELKFASLKDFVPLPRVEAMLIDGEYDVVCGLAKTAARQAKFNMIDIPLYVTSTVLAARIDDKANIKSFDDIRKLGDDGIVLAVNKTMQADMLSKQPGIKVDAGAKDTSVNLQKLLEKRGRFIFQNDFALVDEINRDKLGDKIKLLPAQFVTEGRYFFISKKASPELKAKLTAAVEKLQNSGELVKLFQKYKPK